MGSKPRPPWLVEREKLHSFFGPVSKCLLGVQAGCSAHQPHSPPPAMANESGFLLCALLGVAWQANAARICPRNFPLLLLFLVPARHIASLVVAIAMRPSTPSLQTSKASCCVCCAPRRLAKAAFSCVFTAFRELSRVFRWFVRSCCCVLALRLVPLLRLLLSLLLASRSSTAQSNAAAARCQQAGEKLRAARFLVLWRSAR